MKDFVSGPITLVLLTVSLTIAAGSLFADLPWSAFLLVSVAASVALWLTPRNPTRSIAQLFRDLEHAPARVPAQVFRQKKP